MVAVTTYVVRAKRWAHGWELHIDGIGVTQSRTLDGAEQMVRDYIETLTDRDVSDATVVIEPDLGGLEAKVANVRKQIDQAQRENRQAAAASRALARPERSPAPMRRHCRRHHRVRALNQAPEEISLGGLLVRG
jgi:hypothetical protein